MVFVWANKFIARAGSEPDPIFPYLHSHFYSVTSSVGWTRRSYKLFGHWKFPHCLSTYDGLLHCRLRARTPPPHVLEQEPNFDQEPQLPSWPCGCWLDLQMQWPLKHHYRDHDMTGEQRQRKVKNDRQITVTFETFSCIV